MRVHGHLDSYRDFEEGARICARRGLAKSTCENAFFAAFHLVEAVCACVGKHLDKHQRAAWKLENVTEYRTIFGEDTTKVTDILRTIESEFRVRRTYGYAGDGEAIKRVLELLEKLRDICLPILRGFEVEA